MNEWALLRNGRIVNVVTTNCSKTEVEQHYPSCVVRDLYSLPSSVLEQYEYWSTRP
jgi:hypothetical protein